ncbi:hypothetical protein OG205_20560 [Lentzea sp. NBC_00516]|uniref:hypothetical protein n=1 Tax=Lentzea sp. NBC_00516 TaxID=2903582 RepID=UPI002E8145C0|nr:hypothetical protein [Lentzea sp. NBC_00516]WUD29313.1 hypothetical protein OG205_20560 [Lentzea sp. NBC_00516]
MRIRFVGTLAAVALVAACGTDVPAGLADKVESGCPGPLKPEPLAVITKGFEVSEVNSAEANSCQVFVSTGKKVLSLGLVAYASQEESERLTPMLCTSGVLDSETKSCEAGQSGDGELSVHAVAGRWNVRVHVYELPSNDEIKEAVQQIIEDLRSSDKTRNS